MAARIEPVIGWREWVSLPDLGVDRIKVKIDTGAATSSLHAFRMRHHTDGGVDMVTFEVHPEQRKAHPVVEVTAPIVAQKTVRNPGGRQETRPVIETRVQWNGRRWRTRINLTRRDEMGFRMLLGRRSLRNRVIVDPGRSFVGGLDPTTKGPQ